MPRREILSPAQREALLVVPVDRAGLIEHYLLSEQDIGLILKTEMALDFRAC
jgi:hypothetical protein